MASMVALAALLGARMDVLTVVPGDSGLRKVNRKSYAE
jgi:hypothetical protein